MALASRSMTVQDTEGRVVPYAWVEVRREDVAGLPLANLYSDRAGTVGLGNPVQTNAYGFVQFFVSGGAFKITSYLDDGSYESILRYEGIGRGSEVDITFTIPKGLWNSGTTYQQNDHVYRGGDNFVSLVADNLNHTPDDTTPGDTAYWMYMGPVAGVTVADVLAELGVTSITISESDPSGGVDGDIWFKV